MSIDILPAINDEDSYGFNNNITHGIVPDLVFLTDTTN